MPLKLKEPRPGKTPYYSIRGTYRGIHVDRTCKTDRRSVAVADLEDLKRKIERGEWPPAPAVDRTGEPTFLSAAHSYTKAGGEGRFVARLVHYFGTMPIADIGQAEIDSAAAILHPYLGPASRNRYVYTPVQAILRHAGIGLAIKRPKGAKGRTVTAHLTPEDAAALISAAASQDREFALLLIFLLYTGTRLGEALALTWDDVRLVEGLAFVPTSKNGDPRTLRLRRDLCKMLERHLHELRILAGGQWLKGVSRDEVPRDMEVTAINPMVRDQRPTVRCGPEQTDPNGRPGDLTRLSPARIRVFRFHYGGNLYRLLRGATLKVCGIAIPPRPKKGESHRWPKHRLSWVNFHTFRHTWATFMRRYGGIDLQGLVATGNWRHAKSAARYAHVAAHEEWDRVERLPAIKLDAG